MARDGSALRQHIEGIKTHVNVRAIKDGALTVVVDSANSVGALVTPELIRELGCKVLSLNSQLEWNVSRQAP